MKHLFASILLIFCFVEISIAEDIEDYSYTINTDNTITIKEYIGNRDIETIIVPQTIEGKSVKYIKKILGSKASKVKALFIPSNVQLNGSTNINQNQMFLECGVLGENVILPYDLFPFYYSNDKSREAALKCIYTFGASDYTVEKLCGNGSFLTDIGHVTVFYNNSNSTETIRVFNWTYNDALAFERTRYEYLIWALEKHLLSKGQTLEDIKAIDLSTIDNINKILAFGQFDPSSLLPAGATVIIDNSTAYNPTIPDLTDFSTPSIDITTTIHYTRNKTKDWNSVCLPFALYETDFPEDSNTKIYTISGADEERIKLTCVENVEAGTPCFICSDADRWDLTLSGREMKSTTQAGITEIEGWKMFGSFQEAEIGAGKFKLDSDGKSIGQTATNKARVYPFRCYLECTLPNGAPERFMVDIEGEEQSITLTEKDDEVSDTFYIDLSGRRIQNTSEPRLIKGRNIIIR